MVSSRYDLSIPLKRIPIRRPLECLLHEPPVDDCPTSGRYSSKHSTLEVDRTNHKLSGVNNGFSPSAYFIPGKSSLIPSSGRGRDPAYVFLLLGQVMCALGTLCPLFCWLELPLWLPSHFLLLLAFFVTLSSYRSVWIIDLQAIDLIFSGAGDTNGDSDDEGSAATNSIMHASADGDRVLKGTGSSISTAEGSAGAR
ncbi:hypothetical protein Tco_0734454 [Tanacetum coccineum]